MRKEDALKELSEIRKNLAPEDVEKIQSLVSEGDGKIDIDAVTGGMSEKTKKYLYTAGVLALVAGASAAATHIYDRKKELEALEEIAGESYGMGMDDAEAKAAVKVEVKKEL